MPAVSPPPLAEKIPDAAMRLQAGPVQLLKADKADSKQPRRFQLLARTVEPILDWYWGALVHDFEGMQVADRIFVDYCHDAAEVLGFGDKFKVDAEGLHIEGQLTPFTAEDRASEVQHKADAGVPYQASIDFRGPTEFEWLSEGSYTQVNGQRVDGPAYIARKWTLRGVAICPLGWDGYTEAQLGRPATESTCTVFSKDESMPAPTASAKTATAPATAPAGNTPATAPAGDAQLSQGATTSDATPAAAPAAAANGDAAAATPATAAAPGSATLTPTDAVKQLQQFVADFGAENGGKWFGEGKSHAEALQLHSASLAAQLKAANEANAQLTQKLAASQMGEAAPLSGGGEAPAVSPEALKLQQNLGHNLAKVAAAIKLPTAK